MRGRAEHGATIDECPVGRRERRGTAVQSVPCPKDSSDVSAKVRRESTPLVRADDAIG